MKNPVFAPTLRATKHGTTATQYIPYLQRRNISIPSSSMEKTGLKR
ncbi:hypothetical protein [Porphyromonas endodontalis]|nr:hypothetical protein [Porphyromonas endodontalis]